MRMTDLKPQQTCRIHAFDPELEETYKTRLRQLGFSEGGSILLLRKTPFRGPAVFLVGGAIFSLEYSLAHKILVQLEQPS